MIREYLKKREDINRILERDRVKALFLDMIEICICRTVGVCLTIIYLVVIFGVVSFVLGELS